MIAFQRLARFVGAEPFRPFRISMASGQSFDIRHPEMISINRSTAQIVTFLSDQEDSRQREHEVSLLLMESVEPLDLTSTQDGKQ